MTWEEHIAAFRAMADEAEKKLPPRPTEPGLVSVQYGVIEWAREFADRAERCG